jgi:hypothetical protein
MNFVNKKHSILSVGISLPVIVVIVMFVGFSENDFGDEIVTVSKTKITDVIPNTVLGGNEGTWRTTNIEDVKNEVDYTIEGKVQEFGTPIEITDRNNQGGAAIPITISVDKLYKSTWSEPTFTFYLPAMIILNPSQITENTSYYDLQQNHLTMNIGQDYSDVEKKYVIVNHHDLFEIGDNILVHIQTESLEGINYIYEKDRGSLEPYYTIKLGAYGYYEIVDNFAFNEKYTNGISVNSIQKESLP